MLGYAPPPKNNINNIVACHRPLGCNDRVQQCDLWRLYWVHKVHFQHEKSTSSDLEIENCQADRLVTTIYFTFTFCSFGITPTMEKLYHKGVMRTKLDDCQFVCIAQQDYYNILHQVIIHNSTNLVTLHISFNKTFLSLDDHTPSRFSVLCYFLYLIRLLYVISLKGKMI